MAAHNSGLSSAEQPGATGVHAPNTDGAATSRLSSRRTPAERSRSWGVWGAPLVVALVYVAWIAVFLARGHDPRDLIRIKAKYITRSTASTVIRPDPHYHYLSDRKGYDGMDYYFIAADPVNARYYVDSAKYRYTRIVYPLVARAVAFGRFDALPYAMIFVNIAAMVGSTLFLALALRRRGVSPWLSLVFGFYAGLFFATTWDLTEPLAFTFVLLAILLLEARVAPSFLGGAAAFALAALTRESLAVFPLIYACFLPSFTSDPTAETLRRRARLLRAAAFLALSVGPLLLWKAFLLSWLSGKDRSSTLVPDPIPFHGLFVYFPWNASRVQEIACVVLPALICAVLAIRAARRGAARPEIWALLVNVVLFVALLGPSSFWNYTASGRISAGVILCALLCIPAFDAVNGGKRGWLWLCAPLWLILTPVLYLAPFFSKALY